jgi:hypothetical protein
MNIFSSTLTIVNAGTGDIKHVAVSVSVAVS